MEDTLEGVWLNNFGARRVYIPGAYTFAATRVGYEVTEYYGLRAFWKM